MEAVFSLLDTSGRFLVRLGQRVRSSCVLPDGWSSAQGHAMDISDLSEHPRVKGSGRRSEVAGVPNRDMSMRTGADRFEMPLAEVTEAKERVVPAAVEGGLVDGDSVWVRPLLDAILSWRQTGYVYLQRAVGTGSTWVSLGGALALPDTTGGR